MDWGNQLIDHLPNWGTEVWINIATSVSVAICVSTWIAMGWIRRGRLNHVLDNERLAITFVLLGFILFFISRAIDVGRAGMTIATPWLLGAGVFLSLSCIVCTVIVVRKHEEYGIFKGDDWKPGDPDRRSGFDRRKTT